MGEFPETCPRRHEDTTGHFLCWGSGEFGQHCHGHSREVAYIDGAIDRFCGAVDGRVRLVGCGASHTVVVTNANDVYVWGNGNSGQLGCGDLSTHMEAKKVDLYKGQRSAVKVTGVACGGRHTMLWLANGHVYGFGNNSFAQLGFDFQKRHSKEKQTQAILLKSLAHRPVAQVACGDKHSIFRFKDGHVACAGHNAHGQIGAGDRQEAMEPKSLKGCQQPIKFIAAGSQHSLAVTESGEILMWGLGKACGHTGDLLKPTSAHTHLQNVIAVAGGCTHSMALTANGSVYTWGTGTDGQLGHGENVCYLAAPRRVKDRHVISRVIQIDCGETYSAAVTEKGLLYMWGKNSHTIMPDKPTSHKLFLPHGVNKNFYGGRVLNVYCGSWHASVVIGRPGLLVRDEEDSGESDEEIEQTLTSGRRSGRTPRQFELDNAMHLGDSDSENENDFIGNVALRDAMMSREKTRVSLAEFYAPSPDISRDVPIPSPEIHLPNSDDGNPDIWPDTSRSKSTLLVVQVPLQPAASYAEAATSPMTLTTLTTTSGSTTSGSAYSLRNGPGHVQDGNPHRHHKTPRRINPHRHNGMDSPRVDKSKQTCSPVTEFVQISKSTADAFTLPREASSLAKKHVDFAELEDSRFKQPLVSPDRYSRLSSKHKHIREASPFKQREPTPTNANYIDKPIKYQEYMKDNPSPPQSRLRHIDNSVSYNRDSILMDSPLFKGYRQHNANTANNANTPSIPELTEDERQYRPTVPKHTPRKLKKPKKPGEANFGLQISRSKTIVGPHHADMFDNSDRLAQLRRYSSVHKPQATVSRSCERLRPMKARHVSIPTGKVDYSMGSSQQDIDTLCVDLCQSSSPAFPTGAMWKDRNDWDMPEPPRKVAAGIVKMYIENNEVVGTIGQPLYASLSDGSGPGGDINDETVLMVQPLRKNKVETDTDRAHVGTDRMHIDTGADKHRGIALPAIENAPSSSRNKPHMQVALESDIYVPSAYGNNVVDSRMG